MQVALARDSSKPPPPVLRFDPDEWDNWRWRLSNLYRIITDEGKEIAFRPNEVQAHFIQDGVIWFLNEILKARQEGFCLDPFTRILTADLRWIPIGELLPGQEIVAVDERVPGGRGMSRKMRTAVVQAGVTVRRDAYRIVFDDGRDVICTAQHPWLSRNGRRDPVWRTLPEPGRSPHGHLQIDTQVRWITKPWGEPTVEDGWFGGMLDGEGSQSKSNASASIGVSQRYGLVWERMVDYAEARGYHPLARLGWMRHGACVTKDKAERPSKFGTHPVPVLDFGRMDELFRLVGQTRPTRFIGNRFWEGRELPGKRNGDVGWSYIVAIEPLGSRDMVDLQTSTGTYIAEGFVSHNTTLISLILLDQAVFTPNTTCGIIAHTLDDAKKIFRNKVKHPYKKLPAMVREMSPLANDNLGELVLGNDSSVAVGTSLRGGTLQYLLVSEFGKIARRHPEKANEIVTGAFNTVAPGQSIFVESTAEGRGGAYYELDKTARQLADSKASLTQLDFKHHFYAWWRKPTNRLDPKGVVVTKEMQDYFRDAELATGQKFDPAQRAWYVKKKAQMDIVDEEAMWRENPTTADEAFKAAVQGAYYARQMREAREKGRIRKLPIVNAVVNTFWDIGKRDQTAAWFHQRVGPENRFIDYYENSGEEVAHYVKMLQDRGYIYGKHYLPHDAEHKHAESEKSYEDRFHDLGIRNTVIVPRIDYLELGHEAVREAFPTIWIDIERCDRGIQCLDNYRKRWNDKLGCWHDDPVEDEFIHGADAIRQFAQGYQVARTVTGKKTRARNWRTA